MPKKKETFYFAKKKNRILAFKTMQERNFWVYENGAEPVNRIEIKELATPRQIREAKEAWPNDQSAAERQKFYEQRLHELDLEFVRLSRLRKLISKVTGSNLKETAKRARMEVFGDERMPRR